MGGIDPNIILSLRQPQYQRPEIQTPLERFGKVLTLQNLMRQGQLGDIQLQTGRLNLEQLQQGVREKLDFANYLRNEITRSQQPQTMPTSPQQPGTPTGTTQFAPAQQSQDQTGSPLIGYDPATGTLPAQSPVSAPVVAPATRAPAAAPQVGALGVQPVPRLAGLGPTFNYGEIATRFPLHGPQFIEQHTKAMDAILKAEDAKAKAMQDNNNRLSSLAQGIVDEPTKNSAIATAFSEGRLTSAQRDYYLAKPWNDPTFKSFIQKALTADQSLTQTRADIADKRAQIEFDQKRALFPSQQRKATAEAGSAELAQTRDQIAQDAMTLAQAAQEDARTVAQGGQPTAVQAAKDKMGADRAAHFASATTPAEYLNAGLTASQAVTAAETKRHASIEELLSAGRFKEEQKKNAAFGDMTPAQAAFADRISRQYDNHPLVKEFNSQVTKYGSMKSLLDKKLGGPGDVAIIYDFMKALDPSSVVRESEYQSAARSGNIFSGALARFNGYLKPEGGFLPDKMKQEFLDIVGNRMNVSRDQIGKIYEDYGRRIDRITGRPGTGTDSLTNYADLYDIGRGGGGGVPAEVRTAIQQQNKGAGTYTFKDASGAESKWQVDANGNITPVK